MRYIVTPSHTPNGAPLLACEAKRDCSVRLPSVTGEQHNKTGDVKASPVLFYSLALSSPILIERGGFFMKKTITFLFLLISLFSLTGCSDVIASITGDDKKQEYADMITPYTDRLGALSDEFNLIRDSEDVGADEFIARLDTIAVELTDLSDEVLNLSIPGSMRDVNTILYNSIVNFKLAMMKVITFFSNGDDALLVEANDYIAKSNTQLNEFLDSL
jgi:hypothetical protein